MMAPPRKLTNDDLSRMVETNDAWIMPRTGIRERRIAEPGQAASDLGLVAAKQALERSGIPADQVDLIIFATMSPDSITPSSACVLQEKLGAKRAAAVDIQAACSGFLYGLSLARGAIVSGEAATVLLVGAEALSPFIDWKDRTTCILFGDGAGAVVLRASRDGRGILSIVLGADGAGAPLLEIPAGGSRMPASRATVEGGKHFLRMNGKEIFKLGVRVMTQAVNAALAKCGVAKEEISLLIPHQANKRIIDGVAEALGLPAERLFLNVERYGNTSSASVPMALHEAVEAGRVKPGDLVVAVAFGAGLTWGAAVIRW